ncbi:hypothetical protein AA310_06940 [Arthrobacter sp. YC-RL1]|uniref:Group 1 glycosyl transferase n=1 Tax=Glutamicibacter soli TaxID=453836 RepID=A0A365YAR3_9MICC|nr:MULTISPECIES: glycosyltransferase [Micrococcaceae]KLI87702.1 hypothetical protein AA310_06940 [Arthrobacter sp. YC-RL1]RBL99658.1 group 1 glycosyl transferase [Glutamicibacter soli]
MRILVFPHDFGIGGSQLNAVEIAATLRDQGHECVIFGNPGQLNGRISELGLEYIEAPRPRVRPTPSIVKALVQIIDERDIQILHGFEWPPSLECAIASHLRPATRHVSTVMSMSVAPFIPRTTPLIVGTEAIAHHERESGRSIVTVQEPPVDLDHNSLGAVGSTDAFFERWNLSHQAFTVAVVSRLAPELKLEGILAAIKALPLLGSNQPVQLVIVGDGPSEPEVRAAIESAGLGATPHRVVMTGSLNDPREAYAAADVVLGMGGSALRAMAFEKPLIVQGENGYWKLLTSRSLPDFRWHGWYGRGDSLHAGPERLAKILDQLIADAVLRERLGQFSLETVLEHYSLERAAQIQLEAYEAALNSSPQRANERLHGLASLYKLANYEFRRRWSNLRGRTIKDDDFNASPIVTERPQVHRVGAE